MSQDKYNLRWHTYSDHLTEMMQDMFSDDFADVTLVCDDKKTIKAHRNILSMCSPVFKDIFMMQPQKHQPVIYLRGIQYSEIECILQFIYLGETKFDKERLNEFLSVSKSLEIRELSKNDINPLCDEKMDITITKDQEYNINSESYYEQEVKDKEIETKFHCSECDKSFSCTSDLYRHLSLHSQRKHVEQEIKDKEMETKFHCSDCDKSFSFKSVLYRHRRSAHEGVKFRCLLCNFEGGRQDQMSFHIKTKHAEHETKDKMDIIITEKPPHDLSSESYVEHEIKDKEMETKFDCSDCDKSFSYKSVLYRHRRSAHEGVKYQCNLCDYENSRQDHVSIHIKTKHAEHEAKDKMAIFITEKQPHDFGSESYAEHGVKDKEVETKFQCSECDKSFSYKSHLIRHRRSAHEGVKYQCNLCDYENSRQDHVSMHIRAKHQGLKYGCNQCDYKATTNGNLTFHVKSEHEGVKYSCNLCDYQAKQQSQLKRHKKHMH